MNFDAWGGTAPRGPNIWSLLPDVAQGIALNGTIRKRWTVNDFKDWYAISGNEDEESDEELDYYHKSSSTDSDRHTNESYDACVPYSDPEMII